MTIQTYNVELITNQQSFDFWYKYLSTAKDAYNFCVSIIVNNNIPLNLKDVHEAVYTPMRSKFPDLPAQACVKLYKEVISALRSIRKNKHKNADNPYKKHLSITLDKRLYSNLTVDGIHLTGEVKHKRTAYKFKQYRKMQEMFGKYRTKDPLIFIRGNRMFVAIPFHVADKPISNNNSVGVDLGMKRLFVTSNGVAFRDKNYLKERRSVRYLKRKLKEKNTKSAKRKLKGLKHKEANLSKDMCYRATHALLNSTDASILVLEDLKGLKKNTSKTKEGYNRKRHNRAISQVPFKKFKEILEHKAALVGKQVVTVSPKDTSQMDSRSSKKDGTRKGCRYYCTDGMVFDADWNAANNIAKKGKHPFSNVRPTDGGLRFLNGRGYVNLPIAG